MLLDALDYEGGDVFADCAVGGAAELFGGVFDEDAVGSVLHFD